MEDRDSSMHSRSSEYISDEIFPSSVRLRSQSVINRGSTTTTPEKRRSWWKQLQEKLSGHPQFEVSEPQAFRRISHVYFDGSNFVGLPKEWEAILQSSAITAEDMRTKTEEIIDCLEFQCPTKSVQLPDESIKTIKELCENQSIEEVFTDFVKIGQGGVGEVYKATNIKSNTILALKSVKINKVSKKSIAKKLKFLQSTQHENIVSFYNAYLMRSTVWLCMEYMDSGSLADVIEQHDELPFTEPIIAYVVKRCLQALKSVHSRHQIHRDIKSDNVLLNSQGEVKLADFGFAVQLTRQRQNRNSVVGTAYWMAPELIRQQYYGVEVDIWSLGVMCMEMASGNPPYMELPPVKALVSITTDGLPPLEGDWSPEFKEFVKKATIVKPIERASAAELIEDEFLKKEASKDDFVSFINLARELKHKKQKENQPKENGVEELIGFNSKETSPQQNRKSKIISNRLSKTKEKRKSKLLVELFKSKDDDKLLQSPQLPQTPNSTPRLPQAPNSSPRLPSPEMLDLNRLDEKPTLKKGGQSNLGISNDAVQV
ncbi:non-specific serine/threonine protein kinase [Entamoeba marina]